MSRVAVSLLSNTNKGLAPVDGMCVGLLPYLSA